MTGSVRIQGQDYMGTVSWGTGSGAGSVIVNYFLNPSSPPFSGTRLSQFSTLYDKFIFTNFKFHTTSANPTTSIGSFILAYDRDTTDATPPSSDDGIRSYMSMQNAVSGTNWENLTMNCSLEDTQDFYYCSPTGDNRLSFQGQLYAAVMVPAAATMTQSLWVEYDIVFMDPQLEISQAEYVGTVSSGSISTSTNQGFNNITSDLYTSAITRSVDSNGNTNFVLNGGNYLVMHEVKIAGGSAAVTFANSTCVVNAGTTATVSTLDLGNIPSSSPVNSCGFLVEKVVVGSGTCRLYGNYSSGSADGVSYEKLRILRLNASSFQ